VAEHGIYELGGNKIYTFKEILLYILETIAKKRILLPISFNIAKVIGIMAQFLPTPPITSDQVELLKYDNVISSNYPGLMELGIVPKTIQEIVPQYLIKE
jgi:NADH dehydrogenase